MSTTIPRPQLEISPKNISEPARCSGVSWSEVVSSTAAGERICSRWRLPLFNIMRARHFSDHCKLHDGWGSCTFMFQEPSLALHTAAVAGEGAVGTDDAVTGNDDSNRIG